MDVNEHERLFNTTHGHKGTKLLLLSTFNSYSSVFNKEHN